MKSRLPRLLGGFPDGMVIVDEQGRILQPNAQAVSLFGVGEGQLNCTPVQALFPGQPVPSTGGCSHRLFPAAHAAHVLDDLVNRLPLPGAAARLW